MPGLKSEFDVVVIGGGHAGLTAAITAAEEGASVVLLERSERALRGGNSRHTRNLRPMHATSRWPLAGEYSVDEYLEDLRRVTGGQTNETMARMTIEESARAVDWLEAHGVDFQAPLTGTLHLSRTNAFFLGGGKALVNALYQQAEKLGVEIVYGAETIQLHCLSGQFEHVSFNVTDESCELHGKALVAAAGGFEANHEWLAEGWGQAAENFLVRGTPNNRGEILAQLLAAGCRKVGEIDQCHAVAIDGRAPRFDGGICTRVDAVPFGIVVNQEGRRFYDEGEDFWPKRYAIWGRLIAGQPGQQAFSVVDAKASGLFMPTVYPPLEADSIGALADKLGVDAGTLTTTVNSFNDAVRAGPFDHQSLDECHTRGLDIEKSHWARVIDQPPYRAWPLRPGITFTYMGLAVDEGARVQLMDGRACRNIFAAGEIMAGNVLGQGYLAGIGMTIGHVFGRIAGKEAARHVR